MEHTLQFNHLRPSKVCNKYDVDVYEDSISTRYSKSLRIDRYRNL